MSAALRWLHERAPSAPPSVQEAMLALLPRTAGPTVYDHLAEAGLQALREVVAEPSARHQATTLLAADALLTYACEAALEAGLDALDRLTAELDVHRFSRLLEEPS